MMSEALLITTKEMIRWNGIAGLNWTLIKSRLMIGGGMKIDDDTRAIFNCVVSSICIHNFSGSLFFLVPSGLEPGSASLDRNFS